MSSPARSLDVVATIAPATTPMVQGRQDLYRDAVPRARSVSYFRSSDLAHNSLPSEKRRPVQLFSTFSALPPIVPLAWESAGGRSSRRRRFRLLGYPHQLGWELLLPVFWIWDCPKIWLSEQVDIEFGRREGLPWSTNHLQCSITVLSVIFSAVYFHVSGKDDLVWTGGLN